MNNTILISILSMAGLGLFFALVLALANQKLKVKEDPRIEKIQDALPGINCGACGFTNCHHYAEALAGGEVSPDQCRAADQAAIKRLSEILGVRIEKKIKESAVLHCGADLSKRKRKGIYTGIKTCIAAYGMLGGEILCEYGCFGYGDCAKACPFGAIRMVNELPKIDKDKCTACRKCVDACPRKLITVEKTDSSDFIYVACNNIDKGAETRRTCPVGCIACGLCQKLTSGVFHVENNLACVQYEKMKDISNTKEVIDKCPTKCIRNI